MAATVLGRRLRFPRIPIFRVFYSLTYTLLYLVTLVFLAITPISMIYGSIQETALQYTAMIGAGYVLITILAVFIYSSRIYTNRSNMSAIGKAYIPIEEGEIGKLIRKMIVKQLERSAIVAWESRPRDLYGEIVLAEQEGRLPPETGSVNRDAYFVGTEISLDPQNPPWGDVQHPGWSSPAHSDQNPTPNVQFDTVVAELPHLIEAQVVSLAPPDPLLTPTAGEAPLADPIIVEALRRPASMMLREYLLQLSYLGLVPASMGEIFLSHYEKARFSGKPVDVGDFNTLMSAFSELLAGLSTLDENIVREIRAQSTFEVEHLRSAVPSFDDNATENRRLEPASLSPPVRSSYTARSGTTSPVTAPEGHPSRATTPYLYQNRESVESLSSVIRNTPEQFFEFGEINPIGTTSADAASITSALPSDAGSVIRHDLSFSDD